MKNIIPGMKQKILIALCGLLLVGMSGFAQRGGGGRGGGGGGRSGGGGGFRGGAGFSAGSPRGSAGFGGARGYGVAGVRAALMASEWRRRQKVAMPGHGYVGVGSRGYYGGYRGWGGRRRLGLWRLGIRFRPRLGSWLGLALLWIWVWISLLWLRLSLWLLLPLWQSLCRWLL